MGALVATDEGRWGEHSEGGTNHQDACEPMKTLQTGFRVESSWACISRLQEELGTVTRQLQLCQIVSLLDQQNKGVNVTITRYRGLRK